MREDRKRVQAHHRLIELQTSPHLQEHTEACGCRMQLIKTLCNYNCSEIFVDTINSIQLYSYSTKSHQSPITAPCFLCTSLRSSNCPTITYKPWKNGKQGYSESVSAEALLWNSFSMLLFTSFFFPYAEFTSSINFVIHKCVI